MAGGERIAGDFVEALDLACVQIHCHPPVGSRYLEHVGHQAGGDGHAGHRLLVALGVGQVGQNNRDTASRIPLQAINGNKRFHDIAVHGAVVRVDDVDIFPPRTAVELNPDVFIGKIQNAPTAEGHVDVICNFLGQFRTTRTSIELYFVVV